MRSAMLFFVILSIGLTAFAAQPKLNVCSITINSSQEIDQFKQALGTRNFNYIELTDYAQSMNPGHSGKSDFLMNACKAGVTCDLMIVSGHFGGTFFGKKSDIRLPLEQLEAASCHQECDGILKQPKEVFLFGCNTLAGKAKDSRTPEQYRQVLLADGIDRETADRVVAFRYSMLGDSFGARMAGIFENTPRIYGFNAIAPSGATIEPLLGSYLNAVGKDYSEQLTRSDASPNTRLASALKETSFVQARGWSRGAKDAITCGADDEHAPLAQKLALVEQTIVNGTYLNHVSVVGEIADSYYLYKKNGQTTAADDQAYTRIQALNRSKELLPLVKQPNLALLGTQIDTLNFMVKLGWISQAQFSTLLFRLTGGDVTHPISIEQKDRVCSKEQDLLNTPIEIYPNGIAAARWKEITFWQLLDCLHPRGEALADFMLDKILRDKAWMKEMKKLGEQEEIVDPARVLGLTTFEESPVSRIIVGKILTALKSKLDLPTRADLLGALASANENSYDLIVDVGIQAAMTGETSEIQLSGISILTSIAEMASGPKRLEYKTKFRELLPHLKETARQRGPQNPLLNYEFNVQQLEKRLNE